MDRTNVNTALTSALCEELARCGVERAVLCPGSRSTPLALTLLHEPGIVTTTVVDERSAGFLALGAAAASRTPVAIVCTSGTAAANLHPAVSEADESSIPLLVLTCDRPPELRGIGAGQTIDQIKLYGSAVRWFCEVGTHEADDAGLLHMRSTTCRAVGLARGDSRPGPVHLNLSWRDPLGPSPVEGAVTASARLALEGRGSDPLTELAAGERQATELEIEQLAGAIGAASRGLILAGRQDDRLLAAEVAALARATGFPILAEPTSQIRCGPHDRARVVSSYDAIAKLRPDSLAPDLVVRFGEMPTSKPLRQWISSMEDCEQLVLGEVGAWYEPSRRARLIIRADPVDLASRLSDRIGEGPANDAFALAWLDADKAATEAIAAALADEAVLSEPSLQVGLAEHYADGEIVVTASSMPVRDQECFLPSRPAELLFLSNRGANGIDGTISSGVGAAIATSRPTWVILGDLALHHDCNGLAAIRHSPVPIRVVVINNDGGGIFEFLPQAEQVDREEFEAIFGTPLGLEPRDYAKLHGLPFVRASSEADLGELPPGSCLVEIVTERKANLALHRRLDALVGEALSRLPEAV